MTPIDHHGDSKKRALETISALSAIFGPGLMIPDLAPQQQQQDKTTATEEPQANAAASVEADSVAAWSEGIRTKKTHKSLSDTSIPPAPQGGSPSSVLIKDQFSLERAKSVGSATVVRASTLTGISRPHVIFRPKVSVVEVPSYKDVDPETAKRIWTGSEEVYQNMERNAWEYNSVGRDWTKVLEEDQMIYDPVTGEYIHPATWEHMEIQRQEREREAELKRLAEVEKERRRAWIEQGQLPAKPMKVTRQQTGRGSSPKRVSHRQQTVRDASAPPKQSTQRRRNTRASSLSPQRRNTTTVSPPSSSLSPQRRRNTSASPKRKSTAALVGGKSTAAVGGHPFHHTESSLQQHHHHHHLHHHHVHRRATGKTPQMATASASLTRFADT